MYSLPVLSVAFTAPVPTNEATLFTSGSLITADATAACRSVMDLKEMLCSASVTPRIKPVSCRGRSPFGMRMYSQTVAASVAKVTSSVKP